MEVDAGDSEIRMRQRGSVVMPAVMHRSSIASVTEASAAKTLYVTKVNKSTVYNHMEQVFVEMCAKSPRTEIPPRFCEFYNTVSMYRFIRSLAAYVIWSTRVTKLKAGLAGSAEDVSAIEAQRSKAAKLKSLASSYSRVLLHCSNFENSTADCSYFECVYYFVAAVVRIIVRVDSSSDFDAAILESEIGRMLRGELFDASTRCADMGLPIVAPQPTHPKHFPPPALSYKTMRMKTRNKKRDTVEDPHDDSMPRYAMDEGQQKMLNASRKSMAAYRDRLQLLSQHVESVAAWRLGQAAPGDSDDEEEAAVLAGSSAAETPAADAENTARPAVRRDPRAYTPRFLVTKMTPKARRILRQRTVHVMGKKCSPIIEAVLLPHADPTPSLGPSSAHKPNHPTKSARVPRPRKAGVLS